MNLPQIVSPADDPLTIRRNLASGSGGATTKMTPGA
jgi:hypothetical protein